METPESKRLPPTSSPDSAVQESPFLRFLSNLTPIRSERCNRMVLETNLPGTPLVFTSPQIDQHRGTQFPRRTETDAAVEIACQRIDCEALSLSWPGNYLRSPRPSGNTDEFISEVVEEVDRERAEVMTDQLQECSNLVPSGRVDDAKHDTTLEPGSIVRDEFGQDMTWRPSNLVKCLEESKSFGECRITKRHHANQASNQLQLHGIRRHLQFEASLSMNTATNYNYSSCSNMQVPVPSLLETRIMSTYSQKNHESLCPPLPSFQEKYMRCQENGGNFGLVVPFPCFGVQLNNNARSESGRSEELAGKQLVGHTNSQIDHRIPEDVLATPVTMSQPFFHKMQSGHGQSEALHLASHEPYDTKALGAPVHCELQDLRDDGRLDPKSADEIEIQSQNSSKGSKKRLPSGGFKSEECKRCNCKRSKCLKLYCDCFAAGVYCIDSCACENCLNKPENDDMILDTRHQIEQRNPLAFAPKIVDTGSELSASALDNKSWCTPSSARHKRGCNCKKSKCLKKYCECYQANVGCSDGCRCEDCKNTFGKKQGFVESMSQAKRLKYLSQQTQSAELMSDHVKNDTTNQLPPTYNEESVDTKQGTQWSDPHSKVLVSSSASNARNHGQTAIESRNRSQRTPEKENCVPDDANEAGSAMQSLSSFSHSRKNLILKSMPSFPPLTPYSNSKAGDRR